MSILDDTRKKMTECLNHFKTELSSIRTGRANSAMLDKVTVEVYGSKMPLKQLANITSPEARQLLISPFDPKNAGPIGKAIEAANLGFQVVTDANAVRVMVPPMDKAMRAEMVKLCHRKLEEAKISIRNIRRDANELARKKKNDGEMAEDELKSKEKHIQDLTDKSCKEADELCAKKEKEVTVI